MAEDKDYLSIRGPVEAVDGHLVLQIPLEAGGWELRDVAEGIGEVVGNNLVVNIPEWLATKLGIYQGTYVFIDNRDHKFNITVDNEASQ